MASPYKRTSKMRKRTRSASWKLKTPKLTKCLQCQTPILPHKACPNCGSYKGRDVIVIKAKTKGKKKKEK